MWEKGSSLPLGMLEIYLRWDMRENEAHTVKITAVIECVMKHKWDTRKAVVNFIKMLALNWKNGINVLHCFER